MPAPQYSGIDVASFSTGEVQTSSRGARNAAVLAKGGNTPWVRLPAGLRAPFGATSWQDEQTDRRNLDLTDLNEELVNWLNRLDTWAVDHAFQECERLFKRKLSRDEIASMYIPVLKPGKGDWPPLLRLKCNVSGSKAVRCWERTDHDFEESKLARRTLPDELRDCRLEACVQISSLWFQAKSFGLVLNISDLVISESGCDCPFI